MRIILALDIGLKRIGVAKAIQNIPLPLPPIFRKNRNQAAKEISQLILESQASVLVVGIPFENDSSSSDNPILAMQRRIRHFVSLLALPSHLEIIFLDESFSSFEAMKRLETKKDRKKAHSKDGSLDSLAAMILLERYLQSENLVSQIPKS
ncbi:Holliday junction resolvase RuvX [uncultured Helicobacter sp.]|uniref:Holliday junction resolvase RuvX n=1 Tax=uncultured Helicobacter sp. TaxID=175537 RepID=UPI00263721A6|nr:Holliday junction resolvase RuvX [uncultured Helicobacter sp.]